MVAVESLPVRRRSVIVVCAGLADDAAADGKASLFLYNEWLWLGCRLRQSITTVIL
jgi:hypothetical protein